MVRCRHLVEQIRIRADRGERTLVTAFTKRLAEELSGYINQQGLKSKWLHSELDAFERFDVLRGLREGQFDCVVGVNLLREGLDLPEVSLVAILDADQEGFLRSERSLIQTIADRPATSWLRDSLRRQSHPVNAACDRRNRPPTCQANRIQRIAWHYAGNDQEGNQGGD